MDEYYDTTRKKVGDFNKGFFAFGIMNIFFLFILSFGLLAVIKNRIVTMIITYVILIGFNYFLIRYSFKTGRRYIAIGTIAGLLIPLLVFGACMSLFSGI